MARVLLENLTKKFGNISAINNLNIEIRDKEFFVLLGPTGAGKTTTLRCIAGLEKPDAGNIHIDHNIVNTWGPAERDVALVFQHYSLYPNYTVRKNLEFPLKSKVRDISAEEIQQRIKKVSRTLQIDHLLDRRTDKLSGGEMQRVAIGRAIVREPRIFLMDEPLSNLDAQLRETLRSELKGLQVNLGATFLYVTHDQVEAMTMGERIGVLRRGKLLQVGTPYEVYNHPINTYVAKFVGTPTMNLLSGIIKENHLIIIPEKFEVELNQESLTRISGLHGEIEVGIRPEDITLSSSTGVKARVHGIENMGMSKIISLKVDDCTLKATVDAVVNLEIDTPVQFQIKQERMHFFNSTTGENILS